MRKIIIPFIVVITIVLLSACELYLNENYPILRIETEDTVIGVYNEGKSGYEYTISGTLVNHGAAGQFAIKVFVLQNNRWEVKLTYGPSYIKDRANFNLSWIDSTEYRGNIRVDFYAVRLDGKSKKAITREY